MSYSDFTLKSALQALELKSVEQANFTSLPNSVWERDKLITTTVLN